MNRNSRKVIGALAFLALLCFASNALAQPAGRPGTGLVRERIKQKMHQRCDTMFDDLNLNEEQKAKLETFKATHRQEGKKNREALKEKREAIRQELEKADCDVARVRQIHEEIKALLLQREDHRLEAILQVREVLTPEQLAQFQAKMKERHPMGRKGHGLRKGGKGPKNFDFPPPPDDDEGQPDLPPPEDDGPEM